MTRDEMLARLKKVEFCAVPTVMTYDMGLQYDYVMPEGAGSNFGNMGSWPVYEIKGIDKKKLQEIRNKIIEMRLTFGELSGTELGLFVQSIADDYYGGDLQKIDLNDMLNNIVNLPQLSYDSLFMLFDRGFCEDKDQRPVFFVSKEQMSACFKNKYCDYVQPWDEMSDVELEEWCERIETEFDSFPVCDLD